MGLAALGLLEYAIHAIAADLKDMVVDGVSAEVPSPAPSALTGKVATLSLLRLRFSSGVAVDGGLPPILEAVVRVKRSDGGAIHPESVPDKGPAILLPGLWMEGSN